MQAGKRGHRAAGAQQPDRATRHGARACFGDAFGKGGEAFVHAAAHLGIGGGARLRAVGHRAHAFGQRDHAPGHRLPIEDARHGIGGIDQHDFGRSAANVEDHRRAIPAFQQDVAAQHGKAGFFLRGDDIQPDAGFGMDAFDEVGAVGRTAARLGRDRAGEVDVALLQLFRADVQRAQCPVHRRVGQAARLREAFAQPHYAAERVDHHEMLARRPRDQQTAVVGAEVDRGIGLAVERCGLGPGACARGQRGGRRFGPGLRARGALGCTGLGRGGHAPLRGRSLPQAGRLAPFPAAALPPPLFRRRIEVRHLDRIALCFPAREPPPGT